MMPDWLPSAVIAVAAIALIVWLGERVAPGWFRAWLTWQTGIKGGGGSGEPVSAVAPPRGVSSQRTMATWGIVILAVLGLAGLLYYVFSLTSPS